jgi:Uma2 family endonuclease
MSSQTQSNWFTIEEYFALERASDRRFEYRDGEVVCMSGGTRQHATIARNTVQCLARLRAGCQTFGGDLAVYVPRGLPYRYPDASVVCGEPQFRAINGIDVLENPVLVIEVLSPSSPDFDRGAKFEQYKSIPSFEEYLLVAQDRPHLTRHSRLDDGSWNETLVDSLDASVQLKPAGFELQMREIYDGVTFG